MAFPDGTADFRSDTVTRPTAEMRRAMAEADVGDDSCGEDPAVRPLQEESAALVGKEAAWFVPSGTMGNQLAINLQTRPGDEVLCTAWAHLRNYQRGAAAVLSGTAFRTVLGECGVLAAAARVALSDRDRLGKDHALARSLAQALEMSLPGAVAARPESDMVLVAGNRLPGGPEAFRRALQAAGVLVGYIRPGVLRFVTHRDVDAADVARVAAVARSLGR